MANEKNVNGKEVLEGVGAAGASAEVAEVKEKTYAEEVAELEGFDDDEIIEEDKAEPTGLKVYRRPFKSKRTGKVYDSYFTKGKIRGKDVEISLVPPDRKGYELLSIVFGDAKSVELYSTDGSMKNSEGGYVNYTTYEVRAYEGDEMYSCKVKPENPSDKQMLLTVLKK